MVFRGWSEEALEFFAELEVDNSKVYWQRNKDRYEQLVRAPMEELIDELASEWGEGRIFRRTGTSDSAPTSPLTRRRSGRW